jgi:hypothetical protein
MRKITKENPPKPPESLSHGRNLRNPEDGEDPMRTSRELNLPSRASEQRERAREGIKISHTSF